MAASPVYKRRAGRAVAVALLFLLEAASFDVSGSVRAPRRATGESANAAAEAKRVAHAALECLSDGVSCVHSSECCSLACVKGQCGQRNKLRRRLANVPRAHR